VFVRILSRSEASGKEKEGRLVPRSDGDNDGGFNASLNIPPSLIGGKRERRRQKPPAPLHLAPPFAICPEFIITGWKNQAVLLK
jgi:hypothetical protein